MDSTIPFCKICYVQGADSEENELISPCQCKGTIKWVHAKCLTRWRNHNVRRDSDKCELCNSSYALFERHEHFTVVCFVFIDFLRFTLAYHPYTILAPTVAATLVCSYFHASIFYNTLVAMGLYCVLKMVHSAETDNRDIRTYAFSILGFVYFGSKCLKFLLWPSFDELLTSISEQVCMLFLFAVSRLLVFLIQFLELAQSNLLPFLLSED